MKRVFGLVALMMIIPAMAFAQLSAGPAVFLKSPVLLGQKIDVDEVNVQQFSFGGDVRFRIGWFQAEGLLLYSSGEIDSLDMFLDAGVALDVAIMTLSLGAGPNFTTNFGESRALQAGLNAKIGADVHLGMISVGLSYIMALDIDENIISIERSSGLLGAQVLVQL
ncbi:MAG: hypothetical protein JXB03_03195 [Spirochaetales bacterium]|nr:hypothetical protein [Spirochaetales bacterium]